MVCVGKECWTLQTCGYGQYNQVRSISHRPSDRLTEHVTIAIDGPVASGKTTVGRIVAQKLGFRFLDTGWMYRAVAYLGIVRGVDAADECTMTQLSEGLTMRLDEVEGRERLLVDGQDVTDQLHETQVERGVAVAAAISGVRRALVPQQRAIAADGPIVMAGRDIGTVVLHDATVKVYLDASVEVRAQRRHAERRRSPGSPAYQNVLAALTDRDRMDLERSDSPLLPACDARVIRTDGLDADETANMIIELVGSV